MPSILTAEIGAFCRIPLMIHFSCFCKIEVDHCKVQEMVIRCYKMHRMTPGADGDPVAMKEAGGFSLFS